VGTIEDLASLRTLALRNVLIGGDIEYLLRKIFRSYSKSFSTPLHLVETLPLADVILHFFEDRFENMETKDLEEERLDIIETEEELKARQLQEDRDDSELFEIERETVKQEGLDKIKLPTEESKFKAAIGKLSKDVQLINDTLEEVRTVEPGIKMVFNEELDDFDKDSFGLLD
jgi:hypothetical protein